MQGLSRRALSFPFGEGSFLCGFYLGELRDFRPAHGARTSLIPSLAVSRGACTTVWYNDIITDTIVLDLSLCIGTAGIAVWGGHKHSKSG